MTSHKLRGKRINYLGTAKPAVKVTQCTWGLLTDPEEKLLPVEHVGMYNYVGSGSGKVYLGN